MYLKAKELPDTYEYFERDLFCLTHMPPFIRERVKIMWELGKKHEKFLYKILADVSSIDSEYDWVEAARIDWKYWEIDIIIDDTVERESKLEPGFDPVSLEEYIDLFKEGGISSREPLPDVYISKKPNETLYNIGRDENVLVLHKLSKYVYENIVPKLPDEYATVRFYAYNVIRVKEIYEDYTLYIIFYKDGVRLMSSSAYTEIIAYETIIKETEKSVNFLTNLI